MRYIKGKTIIEKIISNHANKEVAPGDIVDVEIDIRAARDFGGASVVKNLCENNLGIDSPNKTFFTFDCNPGGTDQKYASNQQLCREFARKHSIRIYDILCGIGTHNLIDEGIILPGSTFVSTDSHANIVGAIGAFGQGMGDIDIAYAFAYGKVWFKVPPTVKVILKGTPSTEATPKDIILRILKKLGANGFLGVACELYGEFVNNLNLSGRITMASMATEMGAIIALFQPDEDISKYCKGVSGKYFEPIFADKNASYYAVVEVDIEGLVPQISKPGHPEDVVDVKTLIGKKIDSAFIGSCTNGRYEDFVEAAKILSQKKVAPEVVLKIVPATDNIWKKCLDEGLIKIFKEAGALIGNAGCSGCADGQIGQNGTGEVTISTGNRNFTGKQGRGDVYLASPSVVAASAVSGYITLPSNIDEKMSMARNASINAYTVMNTKSNETRKPNVSSNPFRICGRIWVLSKDNIDTDMIFHNQYLGITDTNEMGKYTFANFDGYESFAEDVKPGDIVIAGENFGAGSSRQHAVDCFVNLGVTLIIAKSFGVIYERNAINRGFPIMVADLNSYNLKNGDVIEVDIREGCIKLSSGQVIKCNPCSQIQRDIYQRGGLLNRK